MSRERDRWMHDGILKKGKISLAACGSMFPPLHMSRHTKKILLMWVRPARSPENKIWTTLKSQKWNSSFTGVKNIILERANICWRRSPEHANICDVTNVPHKPHPLLAHVQPELLALIVKMLHMLGSAEWSSNVQPEEQNKIVIYVGGHFKLIKFIDLNWLIQKNKRLLLSHSNIFTYLRHPVRLTIRFGTSKVTFLIWRSFFVLRN